MNRTLLALAVMAAAVGATAARADDDEDQPTSAPQGQYQLQTVQTWVPGPQQQVYVPPGPECFADRFHLCMGSWRMVATQGHYENTQQWVWVANAYVEPRRERERDGDGDDGYGHRSHHERREGRKHYRDR